MFSKAVIFDESFAIGYLSSIITCIGCLEHIFGYHVSPRSVSYSSVFSSASLFIVHNHMLCWRVMYCLFNF